MAAKSRLSKGILDMKFMKRTREKYIKEEDDAEGRAMYASEITDKMLANTNSKYILEPSFVPCENLIDGRFSFRGMNPDIERILESEEQARMVAKQEKEENMTTDTSDVQMSKFFNKMKKRNDISSAAVAGSQDVKGRRRKMNLPKPVNDNTKFLKPNPDDI